MHTCKTCGMIADWFCHDCGGFHFCDKHYCKHFYALEAQDRSSPMRPGTHAGMALPHIWAKPKSDKSYVMAVFGGLGAAMVAAIIWFGIQQPGEQTHAGGLIVVALLLGFLTYCALARGKD
jgi:hypothetical protein